MAAKRTTQTLPAIKTPAQAVEVATATGIIEREQPETKSSNHLLTYTEQFIACKEKLTAAEALLLTKERYVKQLQMVVEDYKADLKLAQEAIEKNQGQIRQLESWLTEARAKLAQPVIKAMDSMGLPTTQPKALVRSRSI